MPADAIRTRSGTPGSDPGSGDASVEVQGQYEPGFEPCYASAAASGADLRANVSAPVVIRARNRAEIPTGVRLAIPHGFEGQVRPRSGLAARHGVTVLNAPGTIDADYRGEIRVVLLNTSEEAFTVRKGDRIAQLVIMPVVRARFVAARLDTTTRGEGGFGSTGS